MEYTATNELKVHILVLRPGSVPGAEDFLDRKNLLQVDTLKWRGDELITTVMNRDRLKTLTQFRPGVDGAILLVENGHKTMHYVKLTGMRVSKPVWNCPSTVTFTVKKVSTS